MNYWLNLYKKLHRWPGLILSFILLYFGITGIVMNHRELFAGIDIQRKYMPEVYSYKNWNNAALKGNLIISNDSIIVYGNIGIWVTDSTFKNYRPLHVGFPQGSDYRKVFDIHRTPNGDLYAASLFGLYAYDTVQKVWKKFDLSPDMPRFVAVESIGDSVFALNRSYLFKGKSEGCYTRFERIEINAPVGYQNDVGMFETMWQIHSGEIFGLPGQLFVDFLGLITIFLSTTGIIYFFFPGWIKRRKNRNKTAKKLVSVNKWSLKWHNKTGAWFFAFLVILFFTGMFLRPPLLITIANTRVTPLKFSHLDQPNPWYDKLRDLHYDPDRQVFLLSTSEGMFYMNKKNYQPQFMNIQPPVSVMGINTFEPYRDGAYLIGSFSGLFLWHPSFPEIINYPLGTVYKEQTGSRPIGDFKVSGFIKDTQGNEYMVDYDQGILPLYHQKSFPKMPQNILGECGISLWNFSLEVHTGRIFQNILGIFYILLVPLCGMAGIVVVISGYLLWRKKYKTKNKNRIASS